jgi:serine protease inhibitor ecotin
MGYKNLIQEAVDKLNTPENKKLVNGGITIDGVFIQEDSVEVSVQIPLGCLTYMTREEGINGGFDSTPDTIINSYYNREPFLSDIPTMVSKTSYLIRWMYGSAGFGRLPVSLISDPVDSASEGIIMENCLLAKDRGHFMTVLKMMVTNNTKFDDTFWKKVKGNLLKETSLGFSTGVSLKTFQENGLMETLSDLKESGQDEFSLKDLVPSYYYDKFYTKKQNIEIRLETKETHKTEIQKENNGENDWTPHNFAQTELVDELIVRNWGYDQTVVDKICSDSSLMRGEFTFLGSRKTVKFSGSTSEPLMLHASYIDAPFDYKTYEKLAGAKKNRSVYVNGISENDITTEEMKGYLKRLELIAGVTDENGFNVWLNMKDAQDTHYEAWTKEIGKTSNIFNALRPGGMDTALILAKGIEYSIKELGYTRGANGTLEVITKKFTDFVIDMIENDTPLYEKMIIGKLKGNKLVGGAENSWKGKFTKVINVLFKRFIKEEKSKRGKRVSQQKLKEGKLKDARYAASRYNLGPQNEIWDHPRNKEKVVDGVVKPVWEKRTIDLVTGDGIALCHEKSENAGGHYTEENTFLGFIGDNKRCQDENQSNNYMAIDGDFHKTFLSGVTQPDMSNPEDIQVWMNTINFLKMSTELLK